MNAHQAVRTARWLVAYLRPLVVTPSRVGTSPRLLLLLSQCERVACLASGVSIARATPADFPIAAAFFATTFASPADVVMTSYQTAAQCGVDPPYAGVADCVRRLAAEGGAAIFFKGWTVQFIRVAPLFAVNMPLYEQFRRLVGLSCMD